MNARECSVRNEYLASLERGADWRDELEEFAARKDVGAAWVSGTGSVDDAEVWFYDRADREYRSVTFDEPLEVASAQGTVTLLDGEPFALLHATLSRPSGQALAGYLDSATVFSGEVYLRTFEESIERTYDERTGLDRIP